MRSDVLSKLPLIGSYWTGRELPASDSVCVLLRLWVLLCADFEGGVAFLNIFFSQLDRYQVEHVGERVGWDMPCPYIRVEIQVGVESFSA